LRSARAGLSGSLAALARPRKGSRSVARGRRPREIALRAAGRHEGRDAHDAALRTRHPRDPQGIGRDRDAGRGRLATLPAAKLQTPEKTAAKRRRLLIFNLRHHQGRIGRRIPFPPRQYLHSRR
jgi:hypothetical protein